MAVTIPPQPHGWSRSGHDFGPSVIDGPSVAYIVLAVFWTLAVTFGLALLFVYRKDQAVRLRHLPTTVGAVISVHVYLVLVLIAYPLNGNYPCSVEFWVMSIFLPAAMAMFQASNVRLLSIYEAQTDLAESDSLFARKRSKRRRGLLETFKRMSYVQKSLALIALGVVIQTILTFFLFFGSRRFHWRWGLWGSRSQPNTCRQGAEWAPSVFWQFLWTWIIGPAMLLKMRHIKDTHYWAWQTRLAIIAGLPGTPVWLVFTYSTNSNIAIIDKWFIPPGWFLPGLITMQFVSIFFPLLDAYKSRTPHETPDTNQKNNQLYSMAALETQIEKNVDPLLRWAATREFTAENVVFLRAVRDFKRKWASESALRLPSSSDKLRDRYEEAALIYFTLVNAQTARFNINLDHRTYLELADLFRNLHYERFTDDTSSHKSGETENVITPWDAPDIHEPHSDERDLINPVDKLYQLPVTEISISNPNSPNPAITSGTGTLPIPEKFGVDVFDRAFESVKHDVFLNTWPRFVDATETESISDASFMSYETGRRSSHRTEKV